MNHLSFHKIRCCFRFSLGFAVTIHSFWHVFLKRWFYWRGHRFRAKLKGKCRRVSCLLPHTGLVSPPLSCGSLQPICYSGWTWLTDCSHSESIDYPMSHPDAMDPVGLDRCCMLTSVHCFSIIWSNLTTLKILCVPPCIAPSLSHWSFGYLHSYLLWNVR
jgi:hypothetical protein